MNNIITLIRHDFRQATSNVVAAVVLVGVILIPSFFAWFNVLSSWDPFDNVNNLKVAVASADEGFESDLFPMRVNVGDQVVSQLRANSDIDWQFVSEEEAIEGTKSEEYYAAIVLPKDLSQKMLTFIAPGASPAEIDLYVNEKKNALSSLITGEPRRRYRRRSTPALPRPSTRSAWRWCRHWPPISRAPRRSRLWTGCRLRWAGSPPS